MTIQEYQKECKRTCPNLSNRIMDELHMELGVITEIGELLDIFKKNIAYGKEIDIVNLGEELADVAWYICNCATFKNITLNYKFISTGITTPKEERISQTIEDLKELLSLYMLETNSRRNFNKYLDLLNIIALDWELDFNKLLDNNIAKLKVRFPDKFTQENALNRNLEAERQELEK